MKNLNEWLDQPEVSAAHPPLQVEHGEGHAVRGERGVPGDETQSRVVQSPLHTAQLYFCLTIHLQRWPDAGKWNNYNKGILVGGNCAQLYCQVHLFSSIKMSFARQKA